MSSRIAQIGKGCSHPDVYEPCDGSFALDVADRKNLLEHEARICMEIGCGSGYIITSLVLMLGEGSPGSFYIATDVNPHAVATTQKTLQAHAIDVELVTCDVASGLENRLAGMVDIMVVNPPYVSTPEDEVARYGITAAWAGGIDGRSFIDRILRVADNLLSDKGWLYMVTLMANNPSKICLMMKEWGYSSRIIMQRLTDEESLHVMKFWRDCRSPRTLHRPGSGYHGSQGISTLAILSIAILEKRKQLAEESYEMYHGIYVSA